MDYQTHDNRIARCDCGAPIARRMDSRKFELLKYHRGQSMKIIVEYAGDECRLGCNKCGRGAIFKTGNVQLGMTYVVAFPQKTS